MTEWSGLLRQEWWAGRFAQTILAGYFPDFWNLPAIIHSTNAAPLYFPCRWIYNVHWIPTTCAWAQTQCLSFFFLNLWKQQLLQPKHSTHVTRRSTAIHLCTSRHVGVQPCFPYGALIGSVFPSWKKKNVHFNVSVSVHKAGVAPASEAHSRAVRGGIWGGCRAEMMYLWCMMGKEGIRSVAVHWY